MATKIGELREKLIAAIDDVRSGKLDAPAAIAMAKLASAVTSSLDVELRAMVTLNELGRRAPEIGEMSSGEPLRLVSGK